MERDGQPVTGATAGMTLDMTALSHGGSGGRAAETGPGHDELGVDFGMRETRAGAVLVTEPGGTPVSAPVQSDVR